LELALIDAPRARTAEEDVPPDRLEAARDQGARLGGAHLGVRVGDEVTGGEGAGEECHVPAGYFSASAASAAASTDCTVAFSSDRSPACAACTLLRTDASSAARGSRMPASGMPS